MPATNGVVSGMHSMTIICTVYEIYFENVNDNHVWCPDLRS